MWVQGGGYRLRLRRRPERVRFLQLWTPCWNDFPSLTSRPTQRLNQLTRPSRLPFAMVAVASSRGSMRLVDAQMESVRDNPGAVAIPLRR